MRYDLTSKYSFAQPPPQKMKNIQRNKKQQTKVMNFIVFYKVIILTFKTNRLNYNLYQEVLKRKKNLSQN